MRINRHGTLIPRSITEESILDLNEGSSQETLGFCPFIKNHKTQNSSFECRVRKASPEEIALELAKLGIT